MNIEELFDNELYHNYGMLTTDDANCLINYLKSEVMDYVIKMKEALDASHEAELGAAAERFWKEIASSYRKGYLEGSASNDDLRQRIAELEEQNLNMMALFRDFYELEFNRDECWEIIKKYGGDA